MSFFLTPAFCMACGVIVGVCIFRYQFDMIQDTHFICDADWKYAKEWI